MSNAYNCLATGIGSLPGTDPERAVALALRHFPEAPIWPQLPRRSFREHMDGQYSEGLPGIVADEARQRFWIDTSRDLTAEMERFYERYLAGDAAAFGISEDHAAGFHAFVRALERGPLPRARFLKGHVTGPLTAGLSFKDETGRDIIYNELVYDTVVKGLAMKAAWQIERLGRFGRPVIIFLDEPAMESLGSAFSAVAPETVAERLNEIIDVIHERGGIAGIHCCGNADWSLIFRTRADIVNFDAFDYLDRVLLYSQDIRAFFARGGALAWGIVPTGSTFSGAETAATLLERLEGGLGRLEAAGIARATLLRNGIVTPSCGMGSMTPEAAETVMRLTLEVSEGMQRRIG